MNETIKQIIRDAGADPEKPTPIINALILGYRLSDSDRKRERQAGTEFAKWAAVRALTRRDDDDLPLKGTTDVLFGFGEPASRALLTAYREHLLTRDDLNVIEVNSRLESLRWIFDMARKLECIDWRVGDGLPDVSAEETASETRRRWSVSIPNSVDDAVRAEVGRESISSFVAEACRAELQRREAERAAPGKRGRPVTAAAV